MIERLNYMNDTISMKHTREEIPIGKTFKSDFDLFLGEKNIECKI